MAPRWRTLSQRSTRRGAAATGRVYAGPLGAAGASTPLAASIDVVASALAWAGAMGAAPTRQIASRPRTRRMPRAGYRGLSFGQLCTGKRSPALAWVHARSAQCGPLPMTTEKDVDDDRRGRAQSQVPPPPRELFADRVAVVVNGNAKQVTDDLVDILDQIVQSGDLFVSRSLAEANEIARTIVRRGYPTVLTGGGDGTFVQMVTRITEEARRTGGKRPRFGLLRLGTGNALAWVLGAQSPRHRGVIADLGRLRKEGGSRGLRLLDVEGTLTPFAGLGIDAIALADYNDTKAALSRSRLTRPLSAGGVAYFISVVGRTMPTYLLRGHPTCRVVNEGAPCVRLGQDGRPVGEIAPGETIYQG